MKRTLKKAMSILLAFTLLFGSFAFGFSDVNWSELANSFAVKAEAAETFTEGYYTYTVDNEGKATITDVDTSISGNVTIPLTLGGYSVTKIGSWAFGRCASLTSVIIPHNITSLDDSAFYACSNLTSITIPVSVTDIDTYAFDACENLENIYYDGTLGDWCNISFAAYNSNPMYYANNFYINNTLISGDVEIPGGINSIGDHAFYNNKSITGISIPEGVKAIGKEAFRGCSNLKSITLPSTLESFGTSSFYNTDLDNVYFNGDIVKWCAIESGLGDSTPMYKGNNLYINNILIDGSVEIPKGATKIGDTAFYNCTKITEIEIPDSISEIGSLAFYNCNMLKKVKIPYGVEIINYSTFNNCYALENVTIPESVKSIDGWAFYSCMNLKSVDIPESVTSIGRQAFMYCNNLKNVIIPDGVTKIEMWTFASCKSLEYVHMSSAVTEISNDAFPNSIFICSTTEDCYAKTYAEENGIEFIICDGNHGDETPDEPSTTKPAEVPSTTKPVEVPTTTKPAETEPSTTKPAEIPTTTKPIVEPTTKPVETTKPVPITKPEPIEEKIIKKPSTTEVKYGETLILHADFENIPDGATIEWSVEGEGVTIVPSEDGKTCAVTSTSTGDVTIIAKYTDANGVEHVSEQEIESNASFWQKIVSFFKNLFGISRIIEQVVKI